MHHEPGFVVCESSIKWYVSRAMTQTFTHGLMTCVSPSAVTNMADWALNTVKYQLTIREWFDDVKTQSHH